MDAVYIAINGDNVGEGIGNAIASDDHENLEKITSENLNTKKNIQKQTLESEDFYYLVKNKIDKTKGKIKLANQ